MNQITYNYYPYGKTKALTMSFDDGKIYDRDLIQIFNQYGIKGTFHLNTCRLDQIGYVGTDEVAELYKGHEISLHTHTHPTIAHMPKTQIYYELSENKRILEKIAGSELAGLSYPMGSFGENVSEVMNSLGIRYGRTVLSTGKFSLPENFYQWHPTIHYSRGCTGYSKNLVHSHTLLLEKGNEFTEYFEWIRDLPLMQVWGHSYELEDNDNWDIMEAFCKYISGFDNIWFAQNIEVVDYMDALKRLRFSVDCEYVYNPSGMDVWIGINDKPVRIEAGERKRLDS